MSASNRTAKHETGADLLTRCQEAVAGLERARSLQPPEFGREVEAAQRAIVAARDGLIERRRRGGDGDSTEVRTALDRVNAALSIVVGIVFRSSGIDRGLLDEARQPLQQVIDAQSRGGTGHAQARTKGPEKEFIPPDVSADAVPSENYPAEGPS